MFYQFSENQMKQISAEEIDPGILTVGCLNVDELYALNGIFGFGETTLAACKNAKEVFRSGVEVHPTYTFTELRILNDHEDADDYIALYMKRNLMLVVDISDEDGSTRSMYMSAVQKYSAKQISCEKALAAFFDALLSDDYTVLESIEVDLSEQEESLFEKKIDKDFNRSLLKTKKLLTKRHSYYAQLMDIADAVCENDNDIFDESNLIYVDNVSKRVSRLFGDTSDLKNTVEHLQDAYSSYLDSNMNKTMKIFTVLTSIFFPLTIIVGWYGMNFQYMPEFAWKLGYVYVIILSVVTVLVFAIIGKWKSGFDNKISYNITLLCSQFDDILIPMIL